MSASPVMNGLSQTALDILDKHLTVDEILHTAKVLSDVGITTVYHFLVSTPDTWKTVDEEKRSSTRSTTSTLPQKPSVPSYSPDPHYAKNQG